MNDSLRELQIILTGRVGLLSKQLDNVTKPDEATAILNEMREFNHRVTLVGSLLFRKETEALTDLVEAVRQKRAKVDKAIKDIENLRNMLQVVSDFLALVDEAIDLAKTLA